MIKPAWLLEAEKYIGVKEIKGSEHNPIVLDFWKKAKLSGIKNDEVAWCSAFVSAMLETCGIQSTRSDSSRSYDTWGITLKSPEVGCIVTFWRDNPKSHLGHVAIVVGRDQNNNLMVIGGNQGDAVCIKPFSPGRVVSYRWPDGYERSNVNGLINLPIVKSDGKISTNES